MPTLLPNRTAAGEGAPETRYAYKASLIGSAHEFELTDNGLSWRVGGRSGVWPYGDIASVRLSYRPVSMQARRFRADIENAGWRKDRHPLDHLADGLVDGAAGPRLPRLHGRIAPAHERRRQQGQADRRYRADHLRRRAGAAGVARDRDARASGPRARDLQFTGALFLVGFAVLFTWQIGGFVKRNRPRSYAFGALPAALLP